MITNRILLLIYLTALFGLLFFPVSGPDFRFLGLDIDKWIHAVLFGGLAVIFRLNLVESRPAFLVSVSAASIIAAVTELVQAPLVYRGAEFQDFFAGVLGALLGGTFAQLVLSSVRLQRLLGLIVSVLGMMIGTLFLVADFIGIGDPSRIGVIQISGMAFGGLLALGGARMQLRDMRSKSQRL